jgi:hypothetical protein
MRRKNSKLVNRFRNERWRLEPYRKTPIKDVPSSVIRTHIEWYESLTGGDSAPKRLFKREYLLALQERKYRIRKKRNERNRTTTT